jgi:DNA polymerase-3 subunit delta
MAVIAHTRLQEYIDQSQVSNFAPVFLVHGEELLCKRALDTLLAALLPGKARDLNYEPLDGTDAQVPEALEKVNTFSLLAATKVVALLDATVFYSQVEPAEFLRKSSEAHQRGDLKRAAVPLLTLLSRKGLSFEDIDAGNRAKSLGAAAPESGEDTWLEDVLAYCRENALKIPARSDPAKLLQNAVEKGFPKHNHLIISTDRIDRRHGLYKALEKHGVVVDCAVPKGDGRADRQAQEAVLLDQAGTMLSGTGKELAPAAFRAMVEMTGFDLRTFSNNLEKLASYVGPRTRIEAEDVAHVLSRTRIDPLYEFTNAVSEGNPPAALFYLDSLLSGGDIDHPLQLLAAMANQARRLLVFRDFLESPQGRAWRPGCSYGQFQSRVMPAVREFDRLLAERLEAWRGELAQSADPSAGATVKSKAKKKKAKKKSAAAGSHLMMTGRGKSPYPIYLTLQKAERFPKRRMVEILAHLQQADRRLKSAGGDPKLVLEEAVLFFCRPT